MNKVDRVNGANTVMTEVVVVGLGAVGAATLLSLARQGVRCIGIDRFHPPHDRGSSHGESRITRLAVGEGAAYAPLVRRSHELWRQLEDETGEELLLQTGGLVMGPRGGAAQHHGKDDFVRRTITVAEENAIVHEVLAADEIGRRYPQLSLAGNEWACFEPSAGMLFPERCVATQLHRARQLGATLRLGERVLGVETIAGGVAITTDAGRLEAAEAIVAAGPWTPTLARGRLSRLAEVYRQTLHWFTAEDPSAYRPDRFPVFIWLHGESEEDYFYGFPSLPGSTSVKVASERYGDPVLAEGASRTVAASESAAIHDRHVSGRLRGVTAKRERASSCLYTVTPDSGFVVDAPSEQEHVTNVSACSGHGFKHSAALGEHLVHRLQGRSERIQAFEATRFDLAR